MKEYITRIIQEIMLKNIPILLNKPEQEFECIKKLVNTIEAIEIISILLKHSFGVVLSSFICIDSSVTLLLSNL
jgi:hypothetical protein